jgi:hypothetical protein
MTAQTVTLEWLNQVEQHVCLQPPYMKLLHKDQRESQTMKSFLIASALSIASLSAFAIPQDLGTLDDDTAAFSARFAAGQASSLFSKVYSFTLTSTDPQSAVVNLTWTDGSADPAKQLANLVAHLTGGSLTDELIDTNLRDYVSFAGLGLGDYTLTITGEIIGAKASGYGGTLTLTPVPEPESLALALAGLGAVGFLARRRRSN